MMQNGRGGERNLSHLPPGPALLNAVVSHSYVLHAAHVLTYFHAYIDNVDMEARIMR